MKSRVTTVTKRYVELNFDREDDNVVINPDDETVEPTKLELVHKPSEYSYKDEIKIVKTDTGYRVGYLVDDDDPLDPTQDWDGFGQFGEGGSRASRESNEIYWDARGCDRYHEPKFNTWEALHELAYNVWPNRTDKDEKDLLKDPSGDIKRENIRLPYRGKWDAIIKQHEADGDFGDPDAVFLNIYEHGGKMYEVPGDAAYHVDAAFDWSFGGAVWVPDKVLREDEPKGLSKKKRREMMVKWARQAVSVYNDYMNGSVYGVVIQDHDANGDLIEEDSCYGFFGSDDAEKELESRMNAKSI